MNIPIRINKLIADIDREKLEQKYDIFSITTSQEYIGSPIFLDKLNLEDFVESIMYISGKTMYILLKQALDNKSRIKDTLNKMKCGGDLAIKQENPYEMPDYIIVQLLLNTLSQHEIESMKFDNLTGHLYCFENKSAKRKVVDNKKIIPHVCALELRVKESMILKMNVVTFTNIIFKNMMKFNQKKPFEKFPQYQLANNKTMCRKFEEKKGDTFVIRQIGHQKNTKQFLNLSSMDKFNRTKMGVLYNVIKLFNSSMAGVCQLKFEEIEDYTLIQNVKKTQDTITKSIAKIIEKARVNIVDLVGEDYSTDMCERVATELENKYKCHAEIGAPKMDALNICLVHNQEYYLDKEDPYNNQYPGCAIQHITIENLKDDFKNYVATIVQEVLIKHDIEQERISIFDWAKLGYAGKVDFGIQRKDFYYFMTVLPDGKFDIHKVAKCSMEQEEKVGDFEDCIRAFEENTSNKSDQEDKYVLIRYGGNINIIVQSDIITIPNIEDIAYELESGNNQLRNKLMRDKLLMSITDIKYYRYKGEYYYFAGIVGSGMKPEINNAANVRKIMVCGQSKNIFEQMLPLLNVPFVCNARLTVVPFPFKYLKEYARHEQKLGGSTKID